MTDDEPTNLTQAHAALDQHLAGLRECREGLSLIAHRGLAESRMVHGDYLTNELLQQAAAGILLQLELDDEPAFPAEERWVVQQFMRVARGQLRERFDELAMLGEYGYGALLVRHGWRDTNSLAVLVCSALLFKFMIDDAELANLDE